VRDSGSPLRAFLIIGGFNGLFHSVRTSSSSSTVALHCLREFFRSLIAILRIFLQVFTDDALFDFHIHSSGETGDYGAGCHRWVAPAERKRMAGALWSFRKEQREAIDVDALVLFEV
jgi:hypothetical protein